jgi:AraC-like DNA-binding protein
MTAEAAQALPQTCCPTVWLWPGQALYAGPGLNLAPHSGSVWCLAVGVDGPLTLTTDGWQRSARSVLIPPRLKHHLNTHGGRMVSCYLEPTSRRQIRETGADETQLAFMPTDDESACRWLDLAAPPVNRLIDPRIAEAARRLRDDPAATIPSRELARGAGLSESRFLHLFRDELGTSLRRYRLWVRLVHAGRAIAAGENLTTAAVESGFASPSHLADRFKTTFGLSATQLLGTGVRVRSTIHERAQSSGP